MAAPITTARNVYTERRKESTIYTPETVCTQLADHILSGYVPTRVLDLGCGDGRLSLPYRNRNIETIGVDIEDVGANVQQFVHQPVTAEVLATLSIPDLVVSNPPFNHKHAGKRTLLPYEWTKLIFQTWGEQTPLCLIAPMGYRLNQRIRSVRYKELRNSLAKITSIVSLPLDVFPSVEFHCEVLLFNIPNIVPHLFLTFEETKGK